MKILKRAIGLIAAAGCTFGLLTLTSCENGGILAPKAPDLNKQFDMTAEVTCGDSSFAFTASRISVGRWKVVMNEPYEVQGVTFSYSKDGFTAALEEVGEQELTSDFGSSPIAAIVSALENAVQDPNGAVAYDDKGYKVSSGESVLSFEQGSSAPTGFEIPKEKISGRITDFAVTGEIFKDGADVAIVW